MGDILLYVGIGLGIVFVVLLIIAMSGNHSGLKKWLGPLGGIVVGIAVFLGAKGLSGDGDLEKIRAENKRIREELEKSKQMLADADKNLAAAREEYEGKLKSLESQLESKESERKTLEEKLKNTATQDPMEWLKNLPAEEREKIKKEINDGIIWE